LLAAAAQPAAPATPRLQFCRLQHGSIQRATSVPPYHHPLLLRGLADATGTGPPNAAPPSLAASAAWAPWTSPGTGPPRGPPLWEEGGATPPTAPPAAPAAAAPAFHLWVPGCPAGGRPRRRRAPARASCGSIRHAAGFSPSPLPTPPGARRWRGRHRPLSPRAPQC